MISKRDTIKQGLVEQRELEATRRRLTLRIPVVFESGRDWCLGEVSMVGVLYTDSDRASALELSPKSESEDT